MMKKLGLLFYLIIHSLLVFPTHLRSGYIAVDKVSSLTYKITITVFTDTGSPVLFGGPQDVLDFGDGTQTLVPETAGSPVPGLNIGIATYTVFHTFPAIGTYTISYQEPNRNEGIINMSNSINTLFYIETSINLDPIAEFYSTPKFLAQPIFYAKSGSSLSLSLGAVSDQDFILLYRLGTPLRDRNTPVQNYRLPENMEINRFTGLLTWDTEFDGLFLTGEFAFNIKVDIYKEVEGEFYKVCTVSKDIQIILEDIPDEIITSINTDIDENGRIHVPINELKTVKLFFQKSNPLSTSDLILTAYSELSSNSNSFIFSTYDSSTAPHIKVGVLSLSPQPDIDREHPYLITVRGNFYGFGKDVSLLLFTQDLQPKMIDFITDISDEEESLNAYPNPSTGFFNISFSEGQRSLIWVYDQTGKLVYTDQTVGRAYVDLRLLPSGIYYCTVSFGSTMRQIKLIKN